MKKETRYIILQIIGSISIVGIIMAARLMVFFFYQKIFTNFESNVDQSTIYTFFTAILPTLIITIPSIYTLHLLHMRKKKKNFGKLTKKEITLLLLPMIYLIIPLIIGYIMKPIMASAVTIMDGPVVLSDPQFSVPQQMTPYNNIVSYVILISWIGVIIIFLPWFSFLGYWRKKKMK